MKESKGSANPVTNVLQAATLVAFFFTVDKALGLVRDVVVSRAFGASPELDAYYAAFELPDGLFTIITGSAMGTTLIPILTAQIRREDREGVWRFVSSVLNLVLLIVAVLSIVAAIFAPQIIATVAPGFDAYRATLATQLMRLVLLQTLVSSASGIAMGVLQAHQHFLLPAAAPLAYTGGRILGTLLLAPRWGIFGLAYGGLAGSAAHLLVQVPGLIRYRARWFPVLHHPELPQLLALMGPRMLGLGATYINFVLPTYLGSRLPGGTISAYEYAWRLMQFPETIIGTALGLTIFPTLAERANAGDRAGLREAGGWALRLVLSLAIPAAAGLILLGRPLTTLFLQRGAFDASDTARVVWALQFLALGLIGHSALEVVNRFFYAQRDMWTPMGAALAGLAINAGVGWLLLGPLAQGAIALANSLGACTQVIVLMMVIRARLGGLEERELAHTVARTSAATAVMAAVVLIVRGIIPGAILGTLAALAAGALSYLAAAYAFRVETLIDMVELLRRRGRTHLPLE